jgi:hypothetical protein
MREGAGRSNAGSESDGQGSPENDLDRQKLRLLLRTIPAEVVGEELDAWLREGGTAAAAVKQILLSAHKTDSRTQRGTQVATPCVQERDDVLRELRERNKIASNVGFDIVMRQMEEKAAEERKDEVLTDHAWLQLVRTELGPVLRSSTLSRVSRDRRQVLIPHPDHHPAHVGAVLFYYSDRGFRSGLGSYCHGSWAC